VSSRHAPTTYARPRGGLTESQMLEGGRRTAKSVRLIPHGARTQVRDGPFS